MEAMRGQTQGTIDPLDALKAQNDAVQRQIMGQGAQMRAQLAQLSEKNQQDALKMARKREELKAKRDYLLSLDSRKD